MQNFKLERLILERKEKYINLFGKDILACRCQAVSKRSSRQCRKASMTGKQVCRIHGGLSAGPQTEQGRKRCVQAKFVHGWETRELRNKRAEKFKEMKSWFETLKVFEH